MLFPGRVWMHLTESFGRVEHTASIKSFWAGSAPNLKRTVVLLSLLERAGLACCCCIRCARTSNRAITRVRAHHEFMEDRLDFECFVIFDNARDCTDQN